MQLDDEILRHIRQRTPSPHHHPNDTPLFHDTSAAIADLSQQTAAVQARAEASESVVEDVCRDIRQYDLAKRHLTEAIEALRGLSHLMDTAEELQAVAETRRYDLATPLYVTTSRLLDKFARFHHVPKVAEMRGRFAAITTMFRNMLLEDFRKLSVGKEVSSPSMLSNLAPAVDLVAAMGDETTREVIQLVCDREVAAYADIYGNAGVTGRLENVENRLAFVRVQVVEKAAQWALFPRAWGVESLLATLLAKITRAHLAELLDAHGKTAKPPIILKALREAVALERDLQRHLRASSVSLDEERDPTSLSRSSDQNHRAAAMVTASRAIRDKYRPEIGSLSGSNSNDAHHARSNLPSMVPTPTAPSFKGFISRAFEGHLDSYVDLERQQLAQQLKALMARETFQQPKSSEGVLPAADLLFSHIKDSLARVRDLGSYAAVLAVSAVWFETLTTFARELGGHLPRALRAPRPTGGPSREVGIFSTTLETTWPSDVAPESHAVPSWYVACADDDLHRCGLIASTADYCDGTAAGLGEAAGRVLGDVSPISSMTTSSDNHHTQINATRMMAAAAGEPREAFAKLKTTALATAATALETRLDAGLRALRDSIAAGFWVNLDTVGDQGPWVTCVVMDFRAAMLVLQGGGGGGGGGPATGAGGPAGRAEGGGGLQPSPPLPLSGEDLAWVLDRAIYRWLSRLTLLVRSLGSHGVEVMGLQQLLLDVQALQAALLHLTSFTSSPSSTTSTSTTQRLIQHHLGRLTVQIKVSLAPSRDAAVDLLVTMRAHELPDITIDDLTVVVDLQSRLKDKKDEERFVARAETELGVRYVPSKRVATTTAASAAAAAAAPVQPWVGGGRAGGFSGTSRPSSSAATPRFASQVKRWAADKFGAEGVGGITGGGVGSRATATGQKSNVWKNFFQRT